ncbi:hypothetical protein [Wukongibacter sp. M2B1]|uniref:hypothetical protein n=1 Tax=Wukongibacter sp. M2B1 TaxID=3088895 RepID=UPI003D7A81B3
MSIDKEYREKCVYGELVKPLSRGYEIRFCNAYYKPCYEVKNCAKHLEEGKEEY